ncbi:MAG TPA: ATP-binding cassette domain-containing protein, partial [Acidimicrobiales bacterium]
FAVRGSELAAASLGIDVTRYKLLAFALAGFLAGAAGNLLVVSQRSAVPAQFTFSASLFYLAVAVVGGITSLGGAVAASLLFAGLSELFFRVEALAGWLEVVGAGLLTVVLLAYPGGLAAGLSALAVRTAPVRRAARAGLGRAVRPVVAPLAAAVAERMPQRLRRTSVVEVVAMAEEPALRFGDDVEPRPVDLGPREARAAVLEVDSLVVQFGGLRAVDGVCLEVREGEIVGLIGPNGAGKTTTFNAISGMNVPTGGTVALFGQDVTALPVHERAALGVARTFQVIQLFPQLSVFDNLLVATHLSNRSGLVDHIFVTSRGLEAEAAARARIRTVVSFLGLAEIADRRVAGLPFGVLRMVEVARALVTGAPFVMLDEPASGLDDTETDRLAELLFFVRDRLGVSILLIEHDVRMVTSVSDYIYVIDRGRPLARGVPSDVVRDPDVVAAYLGRAADDAEVA